MSTFGWKRIALPVVLLGAIVAGGIYFPVITGGQALPTPAPSASADVLERAAVVDMERLVKAHPDAARLDALDREIEVVASRMNPEGPLTAIPKDVQKRILDMQKRLIKQFEEDVKKVKVSMDAKQAAVKGALEAEQARLASEMRAYQHTLMPQGAPPQLKSGATKEIEGSLRSYMADLQLVAERNFAARRLSLQREVDQNLAGEKRRLEENVDKQMEVVLRSHQAEKLQIQLDIQTATDEEKRKSLQGRLQALNAEEDGKRASLRQSLGAQYEAARAKEQARAGRELEAYRAKLQADIRKQVDAEKRRVIGKYAGKMPEQAPAAGSAADIKAKLNSKQAELKARFESRRAALMAGLQRDGQAAQALLREKQKTVQTTFDREKKRIIDEFVKQAEAGKTEESKRLKHLQEELEALKAQRERVYKQIVGQINDGVAQLAKDQKIPVVLTGYRTNVRLQDLTEAALQKVFKK